MVGSSPDKGYKLFIWLIRLLISASNPNSVDHFKFVVTQVKIALEPKLLQKQGRSHISDLQNFARDYSEFVISAGKPSHAIAQMLQLITALTDGVTLSTFHCQYAKLSLKSLCYQQSLQVIEKSFIDVQPNTQAIDVLTYYYYSGVILMGLNRFKDAITQMQKLLLLPTQTSH